MEIDAERDARGLQSVIQHQRQDLTRNLKALEDEARSLADWRQHYRKHTGAAIAVACTAGAVLGAITRVGRRRAPRRDPGRAPEVTRPPRGLGFKMSSLDPQNRARHAAGETWDHLVGALIGLGSAKLMDMVGHVVPGFADQLERGGHGRQEARPASGQTAGS